MALATQAPPWAPQVRALAFRLPNIGPTSPMVVLLPSAIHACLKVTVTCDKAKQTRLASICFAPWHWQRRPPWMYPMIDTLQHSVGVARYDIGYAYSLFIRLFSVYGQCTRPTRSGAARCLSCERRFSALSPIGFTALNIGHRHARCRTWQTIKLQGINSCIN